MRIAVVGSGIGGLAAAWLLARAHDVTLLERLGRPGMAAHGVDLGAGARVDVPLRVFHPAYYPTLTALYAAVGVETEPVDYSASFSDLDGATYFRYRNVRIAGRTLSVPRAGLRLAASAARYFAGARRDLARGRLAGRTIAEYLAERGLERFGERVLVPALCGIATCSFARARAYPAALVVDYLTRGGLFWGARRAGRGSDDVVARLLAGGARVQVDRRVAAVEPDDAGVAVRDEAGGVDRFDHVVLATPATEARRAVAAACPAEAEVLGRFTYVPSRVVVHRDETLLPARRRDWAPVNFTVSARSEAPMATIWLNRVQPDLAAAPPVFQTWSPLREPAPGTLLAAADLERPVVDATTASAQDALARLHARPGRRVWFCGSYADPGIPLLESAAASASRVARALGAPGLEPAPGHGG